MRRIVDDAKARLNSTVEGALFVEIVSEVITAVEEGALAKIEEVRRKLTVTKPRGVGLSDRVSRDYEAHLERLKLLEGTLFRSAGEEVEECAEAAASRLRVLGEYRKRADAAIGRMRDAAKKRLESASKELSKLIEVVSHDMGHVAAESRATAEKSIQRAVEAVHHAASKSAGRDLRDARLSASEIIERATEVAEAILGRASRTLESVRSAVASGLKETPDDLSEALEEQIIALKDRERLDLELAQLGMAIEVINHEFSASIKGVRSALRGLRRWSDRNPQITPVYDELRSAFDHLDGYLTLFTPLQRRLYRASATITGANILKYVQDLFGERMERHKITLSASPGFRELRIEGYPSTLYPVFVNLVDNSIYWLKTSQGERKIHLDKSGEDIIISDTGPGIRLKDRPALFRRGFTRKPSGRGLGLYISRAVLRRDGLDIVYDDAGRTGGARFRLCRRTGVDDTDPRLEE